MVRTIVGSAGAVAGARISCGETPTVIAPDRPGFLVDALLLPHINDAVRLFETATRTGLPKVLAGIEAIHADTREPGLAPAPLLARLVAAVRTDFG